MRPAPFDYYAPNTLTEAVTRLDALGPEARVLAGGQSLIPAMNLRLARPSALVDLRRVSGLDGCNVKADGTVTIGARVTHAAISRNEALAKALPILPAAARHIAHPQIRNRGTFGGSLANADPASEWPSVVLALGGRVKAVGPSGERWIAAEKLFVTYFTTALEANEIITEIELPALTARDRWSFQEFARQPGAFATVLIVAKITLDAKGAVAALRIVVGGCGPTPTLAKIDMGVVQGVKPSPSLIEAIARQVDAGIAPRSDIHARAEDRRHMAGTLARRCLQQALGVAPDAPAAVG